MRKNKILFFPGLLITSLGSILFSFAGGIYLLEKTGRSDIFAGNMLMSSVPLIFASIFFGRLIDTVSRKKIIVIGDLLNAVLMIGVLYLWNRVDQVYLLYIGSFTTTLLALMTYLALEAAKPQLFNKDDLIHMNSLSSIIESGARILGPTLGGIIFALYSMEAFILFNAISFLVSAAAEMLLSFRGEDRDTAKKETNGILYGFKYILSNRGIRGLVILLIAGNIGLAFITIIPIPYLMLTHYDLSSSIYGGVMGISSVGMILGGVCVSRFNVTAGAKPLKRAYMLITLSAIILLLPSMFRGISHRHIIAIIGIATFIIQVAIAFIDIPIFTYLQSNIPSEVRGQVIGSLISTVKTFLPISLIASSKIVDLVSPFVSIVLGGLLFLGVIIFFDRLFSSEDMLVELESSRY